MSWNQNEKNGKIYFFARLQAKKAQVFCSVLTVIASDSGDI